MMSVHLPQAVVLALLALPAPAQMSWQPVSTTYHPDARTGASLAFDRARQRAVMYGGTANSTLSLAETWEFDGAEWIPTSPNPKPPALSFHGLAFDASRSVTVLFGGVSATSFQTTISNETWEWNGQSWTQRLPAASPSPRDGFAFAFDAARNNCVLFGGADANGAILNETWLWDGASWTQASPTGGVPAARYLCSTAFDDARNRIVLFGGLGAQSTLLGDTWEWDGSSWTAVSPPASPSPRLGASLVYDATLGKTLLFGGGTTAGALAPETWAWDGQTWTQLPTTASPQGRTFAAVAYDTAHGSTVLFGGGDTWPYLGDTWKLPSNGASGFSGHVRFADGQTPVASAATAVSVQVYTHPGHVLVPGAAAAVSPADGSYTMTPGLLGPGAYDVVAVAAIPGGDGQLWHQGFGYAALVNQPWDLDPAADLAVSAAGVASPNSLDFTFPWPAILIHGLTPLCFMSGSCTSGLEHFATLQPYLAEDISTALANPRTAVIPLVPKLRFKAWPDCYTILRAQVPRMRKFFAPSTRFQLAGYSQGGILARKLVWDTGGPPWIEKAVQIATPNDGSCVADWACSVVGGSTCFLTVGHMGSVNAWLNDGFGIPFYLLAGTRYEPSLAPDNSCLAGLPNGSDSIVPVDSVNAIRSLNYAVVGPTQLVFATHEGLLSDSAMLATVQAWLAQ